MQESGAAHRPVADRGADGPVRPHRGAELDDDQQRTWRAFLVASRLVSGRIERQLTDEARIPHSHYEILLFLAEAPGRSMRMGELAAVSTSSRSRLSHAVARLEENGWAVRRSSSQDRRATFAEITDDGLRVLELVTPGYLRTVRSVLFDVLTDAQSAALLDAAEALVAHLGPARAR